MLAVFVRGADPFFVQALRLIAFDSYQRLAPQPYDPDLPVRVVDIDPELIARFGQWPWPRTIMRDLVLRLTERNAAAVTFDILFAEADRTSLEEVVKRLPPDQAHRLQGTAGSPTNDELFAAALKAAPAVLPIILTGQASSPAFAPKAGFAFAGDDPKQFLWGFPGAESNLPALDDAAKGIGSMNLFPNRDEVVRQNSAVLPPWQPDRTFARSRGFTGGAGRFYLYSKIIECERRDSIWAEDRIEQCTHRRY